MSWDFCFLSRHLFSLSCRYEQWTLKCWFFYSLHTSKKKTTNAQLKIIVCPLNLLTSNLLKEKMLNHDAHLLKLLSWLEVTLECFLFHFNEGVATKYNGQFYCICGAHYLTKTTQFEHTSWIMMDTSRNDFKYLLGHKINTLPLPCWHIRVVFFFSFWSDTAHPQALPIHLSVFEPPEPPTSVYITEVRHNSTSDKNRL